MWPCLFCICDVIQIALKSVGAPRAMRVAIQNDAAPTLELDPTYTKLFNGNFTSPLPASIPNSLSHDYNYGVALEPDSKGL